MDYKWDSCEGLQAGLRAICESAPLFWGFGGAIVENMRAL